MSRRMVDRNGLTVEPRVVDGRASFTVRAPSGQVLSRTRCTPGAPEPRTPADLVALGVDLATLVDA